MSVFKLILPDDTYMQISRMVWQQLDSFGGRKDLNAQGVQGQNVVDMLHTAVKTRKVCLP